MNRENIFLYSYKMNITELTKVYCDLEHLISKNKKEKLKNFFFYDDFLRTAGGELLLLLALKEKFNILPNKYRVLFNDYGKPYLAFLNHRIEFNISHSSDEIVCVVGINCNIGVDIEKVKQINYDLFSTFLNENETAMFLNLNNDKQDILFFNIWGLKESYGKCIGLGLNYDFKLKDFSQTLTSISSNYFEHDSFYYYLDYKNKNYNTAICCSKPFILEETVISGKKIRKVLLN